MNTPDTLAQAVEVFARGFSCTRSFTHAYLPERVGTAWVLRDAPRANADRRNDEWIVHGMSAHETDQMARCHSEGRFVVSTIVAAGEDEAPVRAGFKACGYRLITTEALMVRESGRIPRSPTAMQIQRISTQAMANRLTRAARRRILLPEHLEPGGSTLLRAYVALAEERIVGWVRSIVVGDSTWVADLYVVPAFRRRGFGRGLLSAMLRDDRAGGAVRSVLLASHTGQKFYPLLGYRTIATLLLFAPPRSPPR